MARLRQRYPEVLSILGVHSAKFPAERRIETVREAVFRLEIDHPVVNDADGRIWESFCIHAWPSLVLIDPEGYIQALHTGEATVDDLAPWIERLRRHFERKGVLDGRPSSGEGRSVPASSRQDDLLLRYPAKVHVPTPAPGRHEVDEPACFYVADTGHHRVLELAWDDPRRPQRARILRVFGDGSPGFDDGDPASARFRHPHGLAVQRGGPAGDRLYVADTDNHAIRAIDLASGRVETVAGTGRLGAYPIPVGADDDGVARARDVDLRSPWDLLVDQQGRLVVAMAGSHQIFHLDRPQDAEGPLRLFAGTGAEALFDGKPTEAAFNQPSGLAADCAPGGGERIYVADAEASAVRAIDLAKSIQVRTLVGSGLFDFGDRDGRGSAARLQHPAAVACLDGRVWVADSYNHKVKVLDPASKEVRAAIGDGRAGHRDGPFERARFFEPEGLAADPHRHRLLVADTNNHCLRVADLGQRHVWTVEIVDA